jgi:hypothetical protein
VASAVIAAAAALAIASTTVAGGSTTRILRVAPAGVEIDAGHIAVANHHVAVIWQEDYGNSDLEKYDFLRWSSDAGQTWAPIVHLDNGSPSSSASVDICGGYVWAMSRFPTGSDTWSLGLDSRQVDGPGYGWGYFNVDPAVEGSVLSAGITCVGGRRLAAIWTDISTNPAHVKVAIRPLWPCATGCEPHSRRVFDLGPGDHNESPDIVATKDTIYAAWEYAGSMYFKRFSMADDLDATVTPHPTMTLPEGTSGGDWIGAYGARVVIAYETAPYSQGEARVIASTDGGRSFGSPVSLPGSHLPEPNVAVRGREVVVESDHDAYRYHSTDGGETWVQEPSHPLGHQLGAFMDVSGTLMLAEVWDNNHSGATQQKLRFALRAP